MNTETRGRGLLRPMLWVLLFLSASANATMSAVANSAQNHSDLFTALAAGFGAVALGSAAALIMHHYRGRRDRR